MGHCICHLFVSKAPPEASMLCPLLLDPAHAVITDRHKLMTEQPVALPGLKRQLEAVGTEAQEEEEENQDVLEPPAKRRNTGVSDVTAVFGEEADDGFVPL